MYKPTSPDSSSHDVSQLLAEKEKDRQNHLQQLHRDDSFFGSKSTKVPEVEAKITAVNTNDASSDVDEEEKSCSDLYGPYPSAIPVPFLSKDEDTPPSEVIENAKSMFDDTHAIG